MEQHIELMMEWVMPKHVFKKLYCKLKNFVNNDNDNDNDDDNDNDNDNDDNDKDNNACVKWRLQRFFTSKCSRSNAQIIRGQKNILYMSAKKTTIHISFYAI